MAVITINGREFPAPDVGGNLVVATNVSSGKNANGEFVGQKVGRDQYKFDALQWKFLDAATWSAMLQEFDKFSDRPDPGYGKQSFPDDPHVSGKPYSHAGRI